MKIIEAQSATLTNYEVYTHLTEQRKRYAKKDTKGRRPGNLETVVKELLEYFHEAPSPLASKPFPYSERTISVLLERLRPFNFTKAEVLMIMNLRPTKLESLNTIVEEMDDRYTEDQQSEIVEIIRGVLGTADGNVERQAMVDQAEVLKGQQPEMKMEVDG
ncbi:hypothetical protein WAI453_009944 [Rhynchosporium graminicola]|uniref:DNA-directed RNA polymerase III subunit RPC9 n=1 Tax=Rhynchosporium graminicola TaxID=2792576 RepID=A0A1E1KEH8_9HELO|nr:uncharacterized protein RCO7_04897 [Rhynchosporium commune]